jgi:outer membrane receptor protein involved in Fe transport
MTVLAWTRYAHRPLALCAMLWVVASPRAYASADLTALSLEQLLDVTIVGASKYEQKQGEVAAAVSVITRQEIQSFGWHTLGEALSSLPGVYTTYDRQYSYLGMRGFGLPGDLNTRVLITINGNRVNDPTFDAGPTGADFPVDMDMIERIEFIPGPGGAVYGQNAMLGVVNVITRSGAGVNGGELAATYEDPQGLREGRASGGTTLDNGIDLLVSASVMRSHGEDRFFNYGASGVSGVAAGMDGERNQQFFARIARGPWTFEQVYADHLKDDPTGAYLSDPLVAGSYQTDRHTLTQLRFDDTIAGNTLQVSARLFAGAQNYNSLLTFAGVPTTTPADSAWQGGELRVLFLALAKHKLLLGIEGQDNTRENQAVDNLADRTQTYLLALNGYRVGLYIQDEWRIAETLTATLGLREDRNNMTGTKPSPRAALIWQTTPETTLKALYGIAHRAPNVYERDYGDGITQAANLSLGGESIKTLELVADHRIGRDLTLRASVYQWTMQDVITLGIDPVSALPQYQSGENVTAQGLELSVDKTWSFGARLRGSVSAQDAAYADDRELLNSPKRLGKLNLSSPLPWFGLRAGYEVRYDGKRLSLDGSRLGGYVLSNLILSTDRIAPGVVLSVGAYNLFDRRYAQPGADTNWQNAFEQDGRSIRLKLQFNF